MLTVLLFLYMGHMLWRYGFLFGKHSIVKVGFSRGLWMLQTNEETYEGLVLCEDTLVTTILTVLRFRTEGVRPLSCMVWRDSLTVERYRQLRVIIKTT